MPKTMKLFVKFDCGCIGINPDIGITGIPIVIDACDDDYPKNISFHGRDMADKEWEFLPPEEQAAWMWKLDRLIRDGQDLVELRSILK